VSHFCFHHRPADFYSPGRGWRATSHTDRPRDNRSSLFNPRFSRQAQAKVFHQTRSGCNTVLTRPTGFFENSALPAPKRSRGRVPTIRRRPDVPSNSAKARAAFWSLSRQHCAYCPRNLEYWNRSLPRLARAPSGRAPDPGPPPPSRRSRRMEGAVSADDETRLSFPCPRRLCREPCA